MIGSTNLCPGSWYPVCFTMFDEVALVAPQSFTMTYPDAFGGSSQARVADWTMTKSPKSSGICVGRDCSMLSHSTWQTLCEPMRGKLHKS